MSEIQPSFQIRQAVIEDVPVILTLIRALAEYERLSHKVIATEDLLRETLFGKNSPAKVLLADDESETYNEILGFALYFRTFSTFLGRSGIYLEDLFVRESARGRGVGEALLRRLAQHTLEIGGGRLEWSVLDWNEAAIRFYQKKGAVPMDGWTMFRVTEEKLEELAESR